MQALIDFAREDEEIRRIVTNAMENASVQGVTLHIDDAWLTEWNAVHLLGNVKNYGLELSHYLHPYWWNQAGDEFATDLPINDFPVLPPRMKDLNARLPLWKRHLEFLGISTEQLPVIVTICLRPGTREIPTFESARFRVTLEIRPVARLSSDPKRFRRPIVGGLSTGVGSTTYGTIGGIARDLKSPNRRYGVTCAHVMTSGIVDQPAQADSKRAMPIGSVCIHAPLQTPVGLCTPASTSGVNTVDVALVEIDSAISADMEVLDIGPLTGVTPIAGIGQGQIVEFTGRSSGNRMLKVGRLGVIYQHQHNGQTYCFKNVIQLNWPRFYQLTRRPVTKGDSGSWICAPSAEGFGWCGMIIGDDRLHGYAVYAATIEDWWIQQGLALTVS